MDQLEIDMVAIAMRGGGRDCADEPRKVGDLMPMVKGDGPAF